ncbi:cupin domain-containing protein [Salinifilum aidingensis]
MSFLPPREVSRATAEAAPTPTRGYVLGPDEGVPGRDGEVKASNASTGGGLAIYRTVVDGQGPPLHEHRHEDETIVVLDGTMQVDCGEDTFTGGTGSTFFLPRGLPHTFRSLDGPSTILFVVTPGHLDEFFRAKEEATDRDEVLALIQRFF